ncbi:MAG: hypothetical protein AAGJ29_04250 [Pseudomonadota bacterium]
MRFAYLASRVTLPGSPDRRVDAYEHDQMMDALQKASGDDVVTAVSWDDPSADWPVFDAVIIGTTWDYWDRADEFHQTLGAISQKTRLFNPPGLVRWNGHKRYLKELEARGAQLIPTVWLDRPNPDAVHAAFEVLTTDDLVLKRQVGAGADGQVRLRRGEPVPALSHPMMAQPFLESILTEGEISFVFIDGAYSHALVKRAAAGDYRIQSTYGGTEHVYHAAADERAAARGILDALDTAPLYARVDMLRVGERLLLMELELIEPFLYPLQGPELGDRLMSALRRRCAD